MYIMETSRVYFLWLITSQCIISVLNFNLDISNVVIVDGIKNTEFGSSAIMYRHENKPWLLVGAPKANDTAVSFIPRPGLLYRCPLSFTSGLHLKCSLSIQNNYETDIPKSNSTLHYDEQDQLLGAILLKGEKNAVVCAPKQKFTRDESEGKHFLLLGKCSYLSDPSAATLNTLRFSLKINEEGHTYSQAGFSISSFPTVSPFTSIVGAPGMLNGRGGFIMFHDAGENIPRVYDVAKNQTLMNSLRPGSNLGYSVSSGTFGPSRSLPLLVLGSPRHFVQSQGPVGGVFILRIDPDNPDSLKVSKTITSRHHPGSGFGAVLCVMDIDADGQDDLLVGVPYFRNDFTDEGRVDVLIGKNNDDYVQETNYSLHGVVQRGARFGSSIASVGDINNDGVNDIAIGAPFEDEGQGAIYIFNGVKNDRPRRTQHIKAQTLSLNLRSFGFSISQPFDIDENTYNDFTVGAPLSDSVVVLRSRPIIYLFKSLKIQPKKVPLIPRGTLCELEGDFQPCMNLELCFNYSGRGVPEDGINLQIHLQFDATRAFKRLSLFYDGDLFEEDFNRTVTIDMKGRSCFNAIARVKALNPDFFASLDIPFVFKVNFSLSEVPVPGNVHPILNVIDTPYLEEQAAMDTQCTNNECNTDLNLQAVAKPEIDIIFGKTNQITLQVTLTNNGEPSFVTNVTIKPSNITSFVSFTEDSGSERVNCHPNENGTDPSSINCQLQQPFYQSQRAIFFVTFSILNRMSGDFRKYITFDLEAKSRGKEINPVNNKVLLSYGVKLSSSVDISSKIQPEQEILSIDANKELKTSVKFVIFNDGPSPLPSTYATIEIPAIDKKGEPIISELQIPQGCRQNDKNYINGISIQTMDPSKRHISGSEQVRKKRNIPEKLEIQQDLSKQNSFTNYSCGDNTNKCALLQCDFEELQKGDNISFTLYFGIKESAIKFKKGTSGARFYTRLEVFEPSVDYFFSFERRPLREDFFVIFPAREEEHVEQLQWWIILLCCLGGLLFFVLVGVVLWKCGFFRRKKKEELQDWKRKSGYYQRKSMRLAGMRESMKQRQSEDMDSMLKNM